MYPLNIVILNYFLYSGLCKYYSFHKIRFFYPLNSRFKYSHFTISINYQSIMKSNKLKQEFTPYDLYVIKKLQGVGEDLFLNFKEFEGKKMKY